MNNKLLILSMSGGLDSSTLLANALDKGFTVLPIVYEYGQKNIIELKAQQLLVEHFKEIYSDQLLDTMFINLTSSIGNAIQKFKNNRENGKTENETDLKYYMPSRNLVFMSLAAMIGEIIAIDDGIEEIYLGLGIHKHSDIYSRDYWDISTIFAENLQNVLRLNDNIKIEIYAPYKEHYKSKIIEDALALKVPYQKTWTCYEPVFEKFSKFNEDFYKVIPCGECEACKERKSQAFEIGFENEINNYHLEITEEEYKNIQKTFITDEN